MKIDSEVIELLETVDIKDNLLTLNCGQLDRKTYVAVNKALEAIGGKWNRKLKGHVFESNPSEKIKTLFSGENIETPKEFGFFETPHWLALKMVDVANLRPGMLVLEPSAGRGAIADVIKPKEVKLVLVELLSEHVKTLISKGYTAIQTDFLQDSFGKAYSRILMNPPFTKQADIDHVNHALKFLKPGGRLVSIMAAGITFRDNKKTVALREYIERNGYIEELPENTFKKSRTQVKTVMVVIDKPKTT